MPPDRSGTATTTGPILTQTPVEGELYWYLVRGVNAGVDGTVGNATAGLPKSAKVRKI